MENNYAKLSTNYEDDIKIKSNNDFEFIRQKNFYDENNIKTKSYSILEKTNNLFVKNGYEYNIENEQKENINYYSNKNDNININSNKQIESNIERIQNKIDMFQNTINQINNKNNQTYLDYENNLVKNEFNLDKKQINIDNSQLPVKNNKGYYFNYKSDESFNKLNEQNTKSTPIDIKLNSIFNNNYINSNNNNYEYKENSIRFDLKNNEENNNYYKGYMNEVEKRNELINKNTFESINKNVNNDYKNNFNEININNNSMNDFSSKPRNYK